MERLNLSEESEEDSEASSEEDSIRTHSEKIVLPSMP